MEYKIYKLIHENIHKNRFFRSLLSKLLILIGILIVLIPLPLTVPIGIMFLITGMILSISKAKKITHVVKARKSIVFMFQNIFNKKILLHKIYDIKKLYKKIIKN